MASKSTSHTAVADRLEPSVRATGDNRALPTDLRAPTRSTQSPDSRMNRIAKRAHEIYEARGGEHGKALEDWLQAEREIDEQMR